MLSWNDYLNSVKKLSAQEFMRTYNTPFLVHDGGTSPEDEARAFKTTAVDAATLARLIRKPDKEGRVIYAVQRSATSTFTDRISVGRTRVSDIRLAYPEVSKLHAHFTWNAEGLYFITDIGTTNGTFVNGKKLEPNKAQSLFNGANVAFGRHVLTFYLPQGFHEMVRREAAATSK